MSQFSDATAHTDIQPPPNKPSKRWLWLLLSAGGVLLLSLACCCGVPLIFTGNAVSEAPEKIDATRNEIVDIQFDESFKPEICMDFWVTRFAIYKRSGDTGFIYLVDVVTDESSDLDDVEVQMRDGLERGMGKSDKGIERLEIVKSETRQYNIRKEAHEFEFVEGTDSEGRTFYDVSGAFAGKSRNAFIYIRVPASEYDEARIRSIIESIQ